MKLIVITTETFFEGEAEALNLLFDKGLELLHIRKPFASRQETKVLIGQISKNFHARIVIHDNYELAQLFNLKGIHLNRRKQQFLQPFNPSTPSTSSTFSTPLTSSTLSTSSLPSTFSISCSCHSLEELSESQFCDYIFLSPIFDSLSKAGYKHGFTSEQLKEAKFRKIINDRVIALGGITTKNIPLAYSYGFGGVAVIGALWSDFDVSRNFIKLQERFNELIVNCSTV